MKKKTLFYWHDRFRFSILGDFFIYLFIYLFFMLAKFRKNQPGGGGQKSPEKLAENVSKQLRIFSNIFSAKNVKFFLRIFCVLDHFCHQNDQKNLLGEKCADRLTSYLKVHLPVKQGFFLFFFLCGLITAIEHCKSSR